MVIRVMPYTLETYGLTDIGLVRKNNEDYWSEVPDKNFYVVADGMGGHQAGEVASHIAVESVCSQISKESNLGKGVDDWQNSLEEAIENANSSIYAMSQENPHYKGMGTTICCILIHHQQILYAHVGDSRVYRFRKGRLRLITQDHSLLRELLDAGRLDEQQAEDFVYRNIITRAIGTEPGVCPSFEIGEISAGDVYLLCTDGLTDLLRKHEIELILSKYSSVEEAAKALLNTAKLKGGYDNITVLLIKVKEKYESSGLS